MEINNIKSNKNNPSFLMKKFTFFWRKRSPLSQWYPSKFKIKRIACNCVEQYMLYKKAILFNDQKIANKFMKTNNSCKQKCLGRNIKI